MPEKPSPNALAQHANGVMHKQKVLDKPPTTQRRSRATARAGRTGRHPPVNPTTPDNLTNTEHTAPQQESPCATAPNPPDPPPEPRPPSELPADEGGNRQPSPRSLDVVRAIGGKKELLRAAVASAKAQPQTFDARTGRAESKYPDAVILAVEAEWRAGIKSIHGIAKDYGIARKQVYLWASRRNWPPRADVTAAARAAVNSAIIERAVEQFRADAPEEVRRALETLDADGELSEERTGLVMEEYAKIVAQVVEKQRHIATDAITVGQDLLTDFRANVDEALKESRGKIGGMARNKLITSCVATYRQLIAALNQAFGLQRQSFGLDTSANAGDPAETAQSAAAAAPGSYEDYLREAEARGVRLT